ncbi:MAG: tetraacyldisaccharide 4'-kinase [Gammaproteobacteria bacterium]|nr:tetraacyldisaccharide 4'-kinase [Gammaproteobacteria bacterium]
MSFLEKAWHKRAGWLILLWPVSVLFQMLAKLRRSIQQSKERPADLSAPVIVIGNISLGGTGKTPLLISLSQELQEQGFKPGIISRGYGGDAPSYPLAVNGDSDVHESGDEAFLIAEKTGCPVYVDPDRNAALHALLLHEDVDVVLSDDGLQHYKLYRDLEVVVVDGQRLFSNGFCMPAGPLREPMARLKEVQYIVVNGEPAREIPQLAGASTMQLEPRSFVNLVTGEKRPFSGAPFNMGNKLQAVTALGNPQRFYTLLGRLPYQVETFSFPDHHRFTAADFEQQGIDVHQPVVMTEKDAVKCRQFAKNNFWYLSVEVNLESQFVERLIDDIRQVSTL